MLNSNAGSNVEILVHTSAPGHAQDDARYRSLTRAYLDFEPVQHELLYKTSLKNIGEAVRGSKTASQLPAEIANSTDTQSERTSQESWQPDDPAPQSGQGDLVRKSRPESPSPSSHYREEGSSLLAHSSFFPGGYHQHLDWDELDSPDISFNSVEDNADSPLIKSQARVSQTSSEPQQYAQVVRSTESFTTDLSFVADSQPSNKPITPTVVTPLNPWKSRLRKSTGSNGRRSALSKGSFSAEETPESSRILETPLPKPTVSNRARSRLIDISPFITKSASLAPKTPEKIIKRSLRQQSEIIITPDSEPSPKRRRNVLDIDQHPPLSTSTSRSNISSPVSRPSPKTNERSRSSPSRQLIPLSQEEPNDENLGTPQCSDGTKTSLSNEFFTPTQCLHTLTSPPPTSLTIHAPSPETSRSSSTITPAAMLTDPLAQLAGRMSLELLYRPACKSRTIRPLERGYWSLNCASWDIGLRGRCWAFLNNFIGSGAAGWGVWCEWTEPEKVRVVKRNLRGVKGKEKEGLKGKEKVLRVYCWGCIVGHIYLLLHMASESKVRKSDAKWIAGDGNAVIFMTTGGRS